MDKGYSGISYPFRINGVGSVSISGTSSTDPSHIAESIEQIFKTQFLERPMEGGDIYTTFSSFLFEVNDISLQQLLKSRMVDDLERLENRISLSEDDIDFDVEVDDNGANILYINITYIILRYNTRYTSRIKMGELKNNE